MPNKWNENEENFDNQGRQKELSGYDNDGHPIDAARSSVADDYWLQTGAEELPTEADFDFEGNDLMDNDPSQRAQPAEFDDESNGNGPGLLSRFGLTKRADAGTAASPSKARAGVKDAAKTKKKNVSEAASDILVEGHLISFGGKHTAANIFWDQFETGTSVKERAKALDTSTNADSDEQYYSIYIDRSRHGQMGYSRKLHGHRAGVPALMTLINPEISGDNWIGVFHLEERNDLWWLASIHNGMIFDDKIVRGRINAEEAFLEAMKAPGLTKFFAPDAWGMTGTDSTLLHQLIDYNIGLKLKQVHPIKANLGKIVLGTILATAMIGGLSWWKAEQDRKLAELEELERRIRENVAVGPEQLPWYKLTRISDFLELCQAEIHKSIVIAPGWDTQPISCVTNQGAATISGGWSQVDGNFAWLRSSVPADFPQPELTPAGENASFSRSIPAPYDDMSHTDMPWIESKIDGWLIERFQNHGVEISLRPSNDNRAEAHLRPQFNSTDIRLTIRDNPQLYADLLKDVPALVPVTLIYNVENNIWDLILKAHHPVIMPRPR